MGRAQATIRRFFAAMQSGVGAHSEMVALFGEDAVYVEPFTGRRRTHQGKAAIAKAMRKALSLPLPKMRIEVDRLEVDGDNARAEWTCYSPALPSGLGRGENLFTFRGRLIERLETKLLGAGSNRPSPRKAKQTAVPNGRKP